MLAARPEDVLRLVSDRFLTQRERRRAGALRHPADRDAYVAAHALVRECAAQLTGSEAGSLEVVQRCPECRATGHGKPFVHGRADVHLSLAHSRRAVVAGAGWVPLGVDVEDVDGGGAQGTDPGLMALVLSSAEMDHVRSAAEPRAAFLRHWVRKECLVKVGAATLDDLSRIEIDPGTEHDVGAGRVAGRFGPLHVVDWFDGTLDAAVAAAGFGTPRLGVFPLADPAGARGPRSR